MKYEVFLKRSGQNDNSHGVAGISSSVTQSEHTGGKFETVYITKSKLFLTAH